jgi:hypothetical protein
MNKYFLLPEEVPILNFFVVVIKTVIVVKIRIFVHAIYCQVDEFLIAILSKLAEILHRNATMSMYLVPLSFNNDLNGSRTLFFLKSKFNRYDPTNPIMIPSSPIKFGNSPSSIGLDKSKNIGAKLCIGITLEISPFDIERIYKIFAATLIKLEPIKPTQKSELNLSSIKKRSGVKNITGRKLFAHEIKIESNCLDAFFMKTLLMPSEIGLRVANNIHILVISVNMIGC